MSSTPTKLNNHTHFLLSCILTVTISTPTIFIKPIFSHLYGLHHHHHKKRLPKKCFDITLVDGFNVVIAFNPTSNGYTCGIWCMVDIVEWCSNQLRAHSGCINPKPIHRYHCRCPCRWRYEEGHEMEEVYSLEINLFFQWQRPRFEPPSAPVVCRLLLSGMMWMRPQFKKPWSGSIKTRLLGKCMHAHVRSPRPMDIIWRAFSTLGPPLSAPT